MTTGYCIGNFPWFGENNPAKSLEVRKKISLAKRGIPRLDLKEKYQGGGNPNWKGDKVSYAGIHAWVRRNKPKPNTCEKCGIKPIYELANINGEYIRDINNYQWLCRSCHSKMHRGKEWGKKMFKLREKKNGR